MTSSRPEGPTHINLSGLSTILEPSAVSSSPAKSPFTGPRIGTSALSGLNGARVGASSPLGEPGTRMFPKRTRELQTPTGLSSNIWGPPTSGTSTPLFEIPESPNQDGFPDLMPLTESGINSPARRGRAGTLPSRMTPAITAAIPPIPSLVSLSSRPTPSTSPFRPSSTTSAAEKGFNNAASSSAATSALLSRLRAGSMPQRASLLANSNLSGTQLPFNSTWGSRVRAATLTSISSADDPSSPQQNGLKEDTGVRTLDYLGLAEMPTEISSMPDASSSGGKPSVAPLTFHSSLNNRSLSRFRSFSVNMQENKYGDSQEASNAPFPFGTSGTMTPPTAAALDAEYEAIQERVRIHNRAVQDYALNASIARPRARTAGLVDVPQRIPSRSVITPSEQDVNEEEPFPVAAQFSSSNADLSNAMYQMSLDDRGCEESAVSRQNGLVFPNVDHGKASRSLWIGSIPNSTATSTLQNVFSPFGPLDSTRVLAHKNCGFVNFKHVENAIQAKQMLNGKEIFPGAGPVRIGFAKAPSASVTPLAGPLSQTPVLEASQAQDGSTNSGGEVATKTVSRLADIQDEILGMVTEFGAHSADLSAISNAIKNAIAYEHLQQDIPPMAETTMNRMFDAPRLREIRKRIDNAQYEQAEIEQIATEMLPEIAELSSDYLGNTVVQKLFEICSEQVKEQMLLCIAPHLAELGIHKNGTWAAQKVIDVCTTDTQISMITDHLRPYTVPLFLDQFGNYVLQCCLRFGSPHNSFVFETMLSQLYEISQGRFGARAMRACLESQHASKDQQRMLAAAIAVYSVTLASSTNGALLLTWLLDTCSFARRRSVLVPRLIPHIAQLCTHKVGYLTVLKVINQRAEPEPRDDVLRAIFMSDDNAVLEKVLSDQASGVTFVFKVLTSPFLEESMRPEIVKNVTSVLQKIKAQPNQGFKRLMDEVGMSVRFDSFNAGPRSRPMSQQENAVFDSNDPFTSGNISNGIRSNHLGPGGHHHQFQPQNIYRQSTHQGFTPQPYQQSAAHQQYSNFSSPITNQNGNASMQNGYPGYDTPPPTQFRRGQGQMGMPSAFQDQMSQMSPMLNGGGFPQQYSQQNAQQGMYNNYGQTHQQMYGFSPQPGVANFNLRRAGQPEVDWSKRY